MFMISWEWVKVSFARRSPGANSALLAKMESDDDAGLIFIFIIQGIAIIVLNILSITVFWRRRAFTKRTSHFLVNLSIADTMVGAAEMLFSFSEDDRVSSLIAVSVGASCSSLVVISVERLLATWKPFRHRTCPTKYYFIAIGVIWVLSVAFGTLHLFHCLQAVRVMTALFIALMLWTLLASYVAIWYLVVFHRGPARRSKQQSNPDSLEHKHNKQRNKKLTKTLFIVAGMSFLTWSPMAVKMVVLGTDDSTLLHGICSFLMFGNSLVNPIVYIFRMQEFREVVKSWLCRLCQPAG